MVFYDQRSHGRSGRSDDEHATIDQLGDDLRQVIDELVPDGPVVLVGHSMGGMTIMALAEQHPELFGDRVVGVALISTTAGGLRPAAGSCCPMLPRPSAASSRTAAGAPRSAAATELVDRLRRRGSDVGDWSPPTCSRSATTCPAAYVEFVDEMLAATPFEVVAEFFPSFGDARQVRRRRGARAACRPRSSAAPTTSSPRSGTAASCTRTSPARRCSSARAPATW